MELIGRPPQVFLVAGEASGDLLGSKLMRALKARQAGLRFLGVGGSLMQAEGLSSIFPMSEIAVMGFFPVIARLPGLLRRIRETTEAVVAARPDILVIIDSPDFTHRVAKKVRRLAPHIPIVDYVSPTVWAWRPGRAAKMRAYVDHLLALLPFEPAAHLKLHGPPCTYVGHPLMERLAEFRPDAEEEKIRASDEAVILVLPGSRRSEIHRLMQPFGEAVARIAARHPRARFVLPAVPHVRAEIMERIAGWPVKPEIVDGEAAKYAAFRRSRAALAASGTVTLELALARVPMVVGYKVVMIEEKLVRFLSSINTVILPSLIIGDDRAIPEFLQESCTGENLANALLPLIADGAMRDAQLKTLDAVDAAMAVPGNAPSLQAAEIVLKYAGQPLS